MKAVTNDSVGAPAADAGKEAGMVTRAAIRSMLVLAAALGLAFVPAHAAGQTIKIGVLAPLSGTYASIGNHETWAIKQAVDELNRKGGVVGRKLEIVVEDDEANPPIGVRKATKLITQDQVDFLIGTVHSGVTLQLISVAEKSKKILLIPVSEAAAITEQNCSKYAFRISGNARLQANGLGAWLVQNLGKKFYFIGADYAMGRSGVGTMQEVVQQNRGTSVGEVFAPLGTTDFAPYLPKIKSAAPDVLFVTLAGNDVIRFVTQLDSFGLKKTMKVAGSPQMIETTVLPAMGAASEDLVSVTRYLYTLDRAENKAFVEGFLKYSNGEFPNQYSESSYDSVIMLGRAIEKAGSIDTTGVIAALEGLSFAAPRGPVAIRAGDHQALHDKYIVQVKSGKYQVIGRKSAEEVAGPDLCTKF